MPVAYNPGAQPVVIDAEGREIAGHDWGTVNLDDPTTKAAFAHGLLVLRDTPPGPDDKPRAIAVFEKATPAATAADSEER